MICQVSFKIPVALMDTIALSTRTLTCNTCMREKVNQRPRTMIFFCYCMYEFAPVFRHYFMVMPNSEPASRTKHSWLHQKALYYSDLKSNLIITESIHLLFEKAGGGGKHHIEGKKTCLQYQWFWLSSDSPRLFPDPWISSMILPS